MFAPHRKLNKNKNLIIQFNYILLQYYGITCNLQHNVYPLDDQLVSHIILITSALESE
jgi:hypothetical protein